MGVLNLEFWAVSAARDAGLAKVHERDAIEVGPEGRGCGEIGG